MESDSQPPKAKEESSKSSNRQSPTSTSLPVTAATLHNVSTPRVTIQFCTQCKWMLRAAYYAQELLSTFSTALGEVALVPSTGGVFVITLDVVTNGGGADGKSDVEVAKKTLWDRKVDGGFPETKELKKRVRDVIDPSRDLGHVDGKKKATGGNTATGTSKSDESSESQGVQVVLAERKAKEAKAEEERKIYECEDCK